MVGAVGEGGDASIAKGNANALAVAGLVLGLGLVLAFGLRYQDFGAGVALFGLDVARHCRCDSRRRSVSDEGGGFPGICRAVD